jgi:4-diphosphocytidyl-2-C-methyl-D-erythritol kinase
VTAVTESAPAKINLFLHVGDRRADGFHPLQSLAVFTDMGDRLVFEPSPDLSLKVQGPFSAGLEGEDDNLVLRAARALGNGKRDGAAAITLTKNLPVAAGLGGGSSDAAAALRLLARANRIKLSDKRLLKVAARVGADVPVCVDPKPRRMRGIGEVLSSPLAIPKLAAVLVNPGVAVPTKDVFAKLGLAPGGARKRAGRAGALPRNRDGLIAYLAGQGNDLEPAAIGLQPVIARVLNALRDEPGSLLARMSGSGATCFGLFTSARAASAAARRLSAAQPQWWVQATTLG